MITKLKIIVRKYPITRGMISYSILWAAANLIQQTITNRRVGHYNWKRCVKFSMYGAFYLAPLLYCWVRLLSCMWPHTNFKTGIVKAYFEQISFAPFGISSFYFIMSLLDRRSFRESVNEVAEKFLPTYKTAICIWPILQTINYSFMPERNRVVYVSICSLFWTTYLAYMKQLRKSDMKHK